MLKKLVGGILITTFIFGQTTANPQFSVIGDLVIDHLNKNTSLLSIKAMSDLEIALLKECCAKSQYALYKEFKENYIN